MGASSPRKGFSPEPTQTIYNKHGDLMIANYHTHTYRCHHATGTEEEYIKTAINGGIKYMGFSDHIPCTNPDGSESRYRVYMDDRFNYSRKVLSLKEKYKDKIDIKLGYEAEYLPWAFDKMLEVCEETDAEYLILGQHIIGDEKGKEYVSILNSDSEEKLEDYVRLVTEGMRTGYFSYVAHPDVINFTGDKEIYLKHMRKICDASLETDVPLELNFLGIRDERIYPNSDFWELVGEVGCDVVYGFDAHSVKSAYDGESLKKAEEMREKYGLNVLEIPPIRDIRKMATKNS